MLKSYGQLNRQSVRLTRVEFDPLLGELLVSMPPPVEAKPASQIVHDVHLGELLIASPDAPGNPRRTLAPPCAVTRTTAGER